MLQCTQHRAAARLPALPQGMGNSHNLSLATTGVACWQWAIFCRRADYAGLLHHRAAKPTCSHQSARQVSIESQSCHTTDAGLRLTLPLGCKAQVLTPGSQAGQHLVLRRAALGVQLPGQHLDAQQLTQLRVVSAGAGAQDMRSVLMLLLSSGLVIALAGFWLHSGAACWALNGPCGDRMGLEVPCLAGSHYGMLSTQCFVLHITSSDVCAHRYACPASAPTWPAWLTVGTEIAGRSPAGSR